MSEASTESAAQPVPADYPKAWPVFLASGAGAVAGIFWFPLWFAAAQLLRVWAPRGGIAWLRSRGVPEYTDEQYATVISVGALVPIVLRIVVSFNWLQPIEVIVNQRKDPVAGSEWTALLDVVLGIAIAASMTGVLRTRGWAWLIALCGLATVVVLAVLIAFRPPFEINGFAVIPLAFLGWFISWLALFVGGTPARRARRAQRRAARIEDQRLADKERKDRGY